MKKSFILFIVVLFSGALACETEPETNTELATTYFNLANVFFKKNNWKDAIKYYQKALTLNPEMRAIKLNLAACFTNLKDFEQATTILENMLETYSIHPITLKRLALLYQGQGRYKEALYNLQMALALNPGNTETLYMIGNTLRMLDKLDEAAIVFEKTIAINPDNLAAIFQAALIHLAQERYEEALPFYKKAIELRPDLEYVREQYIGILKELGRFDEVTQPYEFILKTTNL